MSTNRDPDRLLRAWLDLMPDEAPDRAIAAVLQATELAPQVRRPFDSAIRRFSTMNRLLPAGAALAIVLVAVGVYAFSQNRVVGPAAASPTATPTAIPSVEPSGAPLPASLQQTWIGANRPSLGAAGLALTVGADSLHLAYTNQTGGALMTFGASMDPGGQLRLRPVGTDGGCQIGATGEYTFAISSSGRQLTLTSTGDSCANREAAVAGTWLLNGCKRTDEVCLGLMDPGTYSSQYFATHVGPGGVWTPAYGQLSFTVPDGWAVAEDWPDGFRLATAAEYATEGPNGPPNATAASIDLVSHVGRPAASDVCGPADPKADRSYVALLPYVRSIPGLVLHGEHSITIGGHQAVMVEVSVAPSWTTPCPGDTQPGVPLVVDGERSLGLLGSERGWLYLIDTGTDATAVLIHAPDAASFAAIAPEAIAIVQSFTFK